MRTFATLIVATALLALGAAFAQASSTLDGSCDLDGTFTATPKMTLVPAQGSIAPEWSGGGTCTGTLDGQPIDHRDVVLRVGKDDIFIAGCAYTGGQKTPGRLIFVNGIPDERRPFGAPVSDPSGDDYLDEHWNVVDPSGDDVPDADDTVLVINVFVSGPPLEQSWVVTGGSGTGPVGPDPKSGGLAVGAVRYGTDQEQQMLTACAGDGLDPTPFATTITTVGPLTG